MNPNKTHIASRRNHPARTNKVDASQLGRALRQVAQYLPYYTDNKSVKIDVTVDGLTWDYIVEPTPELCDCCGQELPDETS